MHQIVLLTAMTAASGLFGGGRQCASGQCGATWTYAAPAQPVAQAPVAVPTYTYSSGYAGYAPVSYAPAPATYAPTASYAPATARYSYAPATCTTGTCPRR